MNNSKKKFNRNKIIPLLLCFALILTGVFAFLTAHDNKVNRFTVGTIDVLVREPDWNDGTNDHPGWYSNTAKPDGTFPVLHDTDTDNIPGTPNNGIPDFAELITPGQQIEKAPYAENTGTNDEWVFLVVGIPTADGDTNGIVTIGNSEAERTKHITVKAIATQTGYGDADNAVDVWAAYLDNNNVFGAAATNTENRVELFAIDDINSTDFTPVAVATNDFCFEGENNFNYYVYAYNNILPANTNNTTPRLFTSVTFSEDVKMHKENTPSNIQIRINGTEYTYQVNENSTLNRATIEGLLTTEGWNVANITRLEFVGTPETVSPLVWVSSTIGGETYYFDADITV